MLTYRDLQRKFRAGLDDARAAGAKKTLDIIPMEQQFAGLPHCWWSPLAYNAGLRCAIGDRKAALGFWGSAIFFGVPEGYIRRGRRGWEVKSC